MKSRVLVLGAGFGGMELSTLLSQALGDEADVTVIEKSDAFVFGYSKIDLMFGRATLESVRLPYRNFAKPGVRLAQETIAAIDPAARLSGLRPVFPRVCRCRRQVKTTCRRFAISATPAATRLRTSVVVLFPLVTHGEDSDAVAVLDLEQRDVAGGAERNNEFAQERVAVAAQGLAAGKRKHFEQLDCLGDRRARRFGRGDVLFEQEVKQTQQIRLRLRREADPEPAHAAAFLAPVRALRALSMRRASLPSSAAAEMYLPDFLALAPEASPRAMNAFCA